MANIKDLRELLVHQIATLKATEVAIRQAMPAVIKMANHKSLKNALQHHLDLTDEQTNRLKKIEGILGTKNDLISPGKGIAGLIDEANELLDENLAKEVNDAAIISCIQKIEHYEICTYGTAAAYAKQLQLRNVEDLLKETLNEEYDADDLLTALAVSSYNKEAGPVVQEQQEVENHAAQLSSREGKVSINERSINAPGGRAGTSHRGYSTGESRGH